MQLIVRRPRHEHVSQDTVEELEAAILRDMRVAPASSGGAIAEAATIATRLISRAGLDPGRTLRASGRHAAVDPARDYFAVMMDLDASRVAPWFVRNARKSVYLFDAWPSRHPEILRFTDSWGVQFAFVSSSQAAERLARLSERCTFIWVPEGVDPSRYRHRSPIERDIDVLQLGRKYDAHHRVIVQPLVDAGITYKYEKQKGQIVFPTREGFVDGLSRSKISICVPSNLTHADRAGDIGTMTIRYLQSMVSKCLVLGHAPTEMIELFGYNPVVEIDMVSPVEQIMELLADYASWQPLIEKNYEAVRTLHTWDQRWQRMSEVLFTPSR